MLITPIILSPMVFASKSMEMRCAYGIAIMAVYWVSEVTPLAVTSLLPLVIFPMLGVLPGKVVCMQYMKDTNILLLGGLLIAVAIEQWNVHKRVALRVLLIVGAQPRRLMLGFMMVTAFISMWITNTATTAMMCPIMEAVLKQLDMQVMKDGLDELEKEEEEDEAHYRINNVAFDSKEDDVEIQNQNVKKSDTHTDLMSAAGGMVDIKKEKQEARHRQLCKAMLLCVCYSANIGGTGTLTGTAPQLVLAGQAESVFPKAPTISFIYWFVYAFPQMLLFLTIGWLYLQTLFLGIGFKHLCFCFRLKKRNKTKGQELYAVMQKQYEELGPMTFAEKSTLGMFTVLVLLWFLREPKFIPGWGDLFHKGYITDGTTAVIIGFLLFQWPSQMPDIFRKTPRVQLPFKTLLNWKHVETKFPWNVLFLLGAGFALAAACDESGLSKYLSCQLAGLKVIPEVGIIVVICTMITFLTEITSNTATATIFLPVLGSLAQSIEVHPFYLMIPATVCASFAFMLPVATPPNAIVFGTGRIGIRDMAKAGFGMNIIGILVVTLSINTWGNSYYKLHTFPDWAKEGNHTVHCNGMAPSPIFNSTSSYFL